MSMKYELLSTSNFLCHLIRLKTKVGESQLTKFRDNLLEVLRWKFEDHWYPEKPFKGSGYRCIKNNGKMDPMILEAGERCGLTSSFLLSKFPSELTLWIDPKEVTYRIGENNDICVLYDDSMEDPWIPDLFKSYKPEKPMSSY